MKGEAGQIYREREGKKTRKSFIATKRRRNFIFRDVRQKDHHNNL